MRQEENEDKNENVIILHTEAEWRNAADEATPWDLKSCIYKDTQDYFDILIFISSTATKNGPFIRSIIIQPFHRLFILQFWISCSVWWHSCRPGFRAQIVSVSGIPALPNGFHPHFHILQHAVSHFNPGKNASKWEPRVTPSSGLYINRDNYSFVGSYPLFFYYCCFSHTRVGAWWWGRWRVSLIPQCQARVSHFYSGGKSFGSFPRWKVSGWYIYPI